MEEHSKLNFVAGLIEEEELEKLAGGDDVSTNSTVPCTWISAITAISQLTFNSTPCPTSACTKEC